VCAGDGGRAAVLEELLSPMVETQNAAMKRATVIAFMR
jgi:hypothetical protein